MKLSQRPNKPDRTAKHHHYFQQPIIAVSRKCFGESTKVKESSHLSHVAQEMLDHQRYLLWFLEFYCPVNTL